MPEGGGIPSAYASNYFTVRYVLDAPHDHDTIALCPEK